jgi:hypothetical protein
VAVEDIISWWYENRASAAALTPPEETEIDPELAALLQPDETPAAGELPDLEIVPEF